jgi:predicted HNH restriction endonuclease
MRSRPSGARLGLRLIDIFKPQEACLFRYSDRYGDIGEDFIEVHHLNPLSERSRTAEDRRLTSLDQVTVLCANCHRMIHRVIRRLGCPVSIKDFQQHLKVMESKFTA